MYIFKIFPLPTHTLSSSALWCYTDNSLKLKTVLHGEGHWSIPDSGIVMKMEWTYSTLCLHGVKQKKGFQFKTLFKWTTYHSMVNEVLSMGNNPGRLEYHLKIPIYKCYCNPHQCFSKWNSVFNNYSKFSSVKSWRHLCKCVSKQLGQLKSSCIPQLCRLNKDKAHACSYCCRPLTSNMWWLPKFLD